MRRAPAPRPAVPQALSVQLTSKTGFDLSFATNTLPAGRTGRTRQECCFSTIGLRNGVRITHRLLTRRLSRALFAGFRRHSDNLAKGRYANPAFERAAAFMEEPGGNLFVTGRAGTGKSTLLRALRDAYADRMVVLAPTGLAAINIGGQTIHSFFGFPPRLIQPDDIKRSRNGRVMRKLEVHRHR